VREHISSARSPEVRRHRGAPVSFACGIRPVPPAERVLAPGLVRPGGTHGKQQHRPSENAEASCFSVRGADMGGGIISLRTGNLTSAARQGGEARQLATAANPVASAVRLLRSHKTRARSKVAPASAAFDASYVFRGRGVAGDSPQVAGPDRRVGTRSQPYFEALAACLLTN
jgi:hypothetical protein